jgi:hypothetical protein
MSTQLKDLESRLARVRKELMSIGDMRPGSITIQYRDPKERKHPFFQISYTHHMRSHSEYVRPENLKALKKETSVFKRFKSLVNQWIDISLKVSQMRCLHTAAKLAK